MMICFPRIRLRAFLSLAVLCMGAWIIFVRLHYGTELWFMKQENSKVGVSTWPILKIVNRLPPVALVTTANQSIKIKFSGTPSPDMAGLAELGTNGCPLPHLLVDDPQLRKYFQQPKPLQCRKEPNWVFVKNRTFFIDPEVDRKLGPIKCDYVKFWRNSDHRTPTKAILDFASGTPVLSDYFKVHCRARNKTFRNVYATVVPIKEAVKRAESTKSPVNSLGLNVFLLGLDSVSRMTFMRSLPKSFAFLTDKLKAVVLKGYNIVGDGTPQAFIPILTGKTEVELPLTRKRYTDAKYCDVYPMIWKDFQRAGYVTLYGEDSARVGTFTYRLKGFHEQPTDHYFRTFYTVAENEYKYNPKFCFGSEPQHKTFFRYSEDFFTAYPKLQKFGVMHHSLLTHDAINTVKLLDEDLLKHLQFFENNNFLNNTILIVMSDHGHRFAALRQTQQGQLEERLPFVSFVAPEWFRKQHRDAWKNLQMNSERLTTPFDIYATLKAIIDWRQPTKADLSVRSISLWDEIGHERNCAQAGVEPHWCVCLNWQSLPKEDLVGEILGKALVQAINHETEPERRLCSELKLKSVKSVKRLVPAKSVMQYKGAKDKDGFTPDLSGSVRVTFALYQIQVRTTPGEALYEATVSYDGRVKHDIVVDLDSVSHINQFGDKPHCIIDRNYFLAKWCVCYDKIMDGEPR